MLYIVATPIGNLEDLTPRARRVLGEVPVIACEDTRRTWALLSACAISRPEMISYREGIEQRAGERLLSELAAGRDVALCTDGGYPGVSDPAQRGIEVQVIPGPSAVTVALVSSGLSTSSYTFKGYPPRKSGVLRRFFEEERDMPHTLVLFESPHRIGKTLAAAHAVLGDREAAVCLELTKKFERVARGFLGDLARDFAEKHTRGEVTLVIAGNNPKFQRGGPAAEFPEDAEEAEEGVQRAET
ncbi:MAG: 16S rRNA (cytidine(1402)-2'-O)-methyltransferase [Verrucomicrobia bacterium]|nr:16S rRNA (cytidine(1402)-2'-O)-methyltransferase [Verrucomicrobiota bacterium]